MAYKPKHKKQDGGFYFADYDVHVKAKTLSEATELLKETHGFDVTKEPVRAEIDEGVRVLEEPESV